MNYADFGLGTWHPKNGMYSVILAMEKLALELGVQIQTNSNIEKIIETLLSIFDLIKLSLISKDDDNIEHDHDLINEEINLNERI